MYFHLHNVTQLHGCIMWDHVSHEHILLVFRFPHSRGTLRLCVVNFPTNNCVLLGNFNRNLYFWKETIIWLLSNAMTTTDS